MLAVPPQRRQQDRHAARVDDRQRQARLLLGRHRLQRLGQRLGPPQLERQRGGVLPHPLHEARRRTPRHLGRARRIQRTRLRRRRRRLPRRHICRHHGAAYPARLLHRWLWCGGQRARRLEGRRPERLRHLGAVNHDVPLLAQVPPGCRMPRNRRLRPARTAAPQPPIGPRSAGWLVPSAQRSLENRGSLERQPQEAGVASGGATKTAVSTCWLTWSRSPRPGRTARRTAAAGARSGRAARGSAPARSAASSAARYHSCSSPPAAAPSVSAQPRSASTRTPPRCRGAAARPRRPGQAHEVEREPPVWTARSARPRTGALAACSWPPPAAAPPVPPGQPCAA
eukprot:scaffold72935_cov63-Phaeocystis_antarctica.AAC.4